MIRYINDKLKIHKLFKYLFPKTRKSFIKKTFKYITFFYMQYITVLIVVYNKTLKISKTSYNQQKLAKSTTFHLFQLH